MDNHERLKALLRPKNLISVQEEIWGIARHYSESIEVFVPNVPVWKMIEGYELSNDFPTDMVYKTSIESDQERSIRKSKQTLRGYYLCNKFDLFVTFTFKGTREKRHDIELAKSQLHNWLKNQIKRFGRFEYIIVAEFHKDGAIHFHGLFKDFAGKIIPSINEISGKQRTRNGRMIFNLTGYTLGFTVAYYVDNKPDSLAKAGNYLLKYITKEMKTGFGEHRYWASHGLETPSTEKNPSWFKNKKPSKTYINEYGTNYTFNLDFIPENISLL